MNVGLSELFVTLIVAVLVIKPEQWPNVFLKLGKTTNQIKAVIFQLKTNFQISQLEKPDE